MSNLFFLFGFVCLNYLDYLFSMASFDICRRTFCVIWWIMVLVEEVVCFPLYPKALQPIIQVSPLYGSSMNFDV